MSTTTPPKSTDKTTKAFVMGHSSPTGDKKVRNAPMKIGTHGGKGQSSGKKGSDYLSRGTGRSRRSKQFDYYDAQHKYLRNPINMAKTLAHNVGVERAFGLAKELAAKAAQALKDGSTIDFMTSRENKRNEGFWRDVAGFIGKRLEIPMNKW